MVRFAKGLGNVQEVERLQSALADVMTRQTDAARQRDEALIQLEVG